MRLSKVKELRLCFSCLKPGHGSRKCPTKQICKVFGCERYHATFLHEATLDNASSQPRRTWIAQAGSQDNSSALPGRPVKGGRS